MSSEVAAFEKRLVIENHRNVRRGKIVRTLPSSPAQSPAFHVPTVTDSSELRLASSVIYAPIPTPECFEVMVIFASEGRTSSNEINNINSRVWRTWLSRHQIESTKCTLIRPIGQLKDMLYRHTLVASCRRSSPPNALSFEN